MASMASYSHWGMFPLPQIDHDPSSYHEERDIPQSEFSPRPAWLVGFSRYLYDSRYLHDDAAVHEALHRKPVAVPQA